MNNVIEKLKACARKKAHASIHHQLRHSSFYRLRFNAPTNHLHKALRVVDVLCPTRTGAAPSRIEHTHLRLVQDLLRIDCEPVEGRRPSHHFGDSSLRREEAYGFQWILDASIDERRESGAGFPRYNPGILSTTLSSCASTRDLQAGLQYHCVAIRTGLVADVYVGNCLITLYAKCRELRSACKVFNEIPVRDVVSWTAIISGFAQELQGFESLELYSMMRRSTMKPNEYTFSSILSACIGSGALGQGRGAHCQVIQLGFDWYLHVKNALISMYCKCGSLGDALNIFDNMIGKDVVSWNSMIAGYALHGLALQAIDLFEEMKLQGVKPDGITFLGVLSSCRHAGLVEEGRSHFDSMVEFGARPGLDHYSCLVDLLGRAGLVEEALHVIEAMPIRPNAVIWGSLLSSCRIHGNVWIGIQAAESMLLLEPACAATHVSLLNLYASIECWDQVARIRKLMKDRGFRTNPGYSWIEIKNQVYGFRADHESNTRCSDIIVVVESLAEHMGLSDNEPDAKEEVDYC